MEHIIQFGITIDDDAIRKHIEEKAMDAVIKNITDEIKKSLPKRSYYGDEVDWKSVAQGIIGDMYLGNEGVVMELAAQKLAESAKRTKTWREYYTKAIKESAEGRE